MKEKLLKLVNGCIDNKEFYSNIEGAENIQIGGPLYFSNLKLEMLNLDEKEEFFTQNLEFRMDRNILFKTVGNTFGIGQEHNTTIFKNSGLTIWFKDSPEIQVYISSKKAEKPIKSEYHSIKLKRYANKTNLFGLKKRHDYEWIETGKVARIACDLYSVSPVFKIISGIITEEITHQEFNAIIKKAIENSQKFKLEVEVDKVNERITKFCKK